MTTKTVTVLVSRPETPPVPEAVRVGLLEIKFQQRRKAVEMRDHGLVDSRDSNDYNYWNPGAVGIRLDGTKSR